MAEIFETGSAVLGVAAVAFKLFTLIVEVSDAARSIRSQLNNDALAFRSFRDLIETAKYSIKFRLPAAGSELVGYMHDRNIFGCIADEAKALDDDIVVQIGKIQLLQQKHANDKSSYPDRFYAAWKWEKIRKPKLEALHPRMEQLKSTIQLLLAIIQLEVMARNGEASQSGSQSSSESRRKKAEIDALRQLIQNHIEAIEQLRKEFPSGTQPKRRNADAATEICYLASSVRNTGTFPRIDKRLPPPPLSASIEALTVTPDFGSWPRATLSPATCPRCYQATITPREKTLRSREGSTSRPRRERLGRPSGDSRPSGSREPSASRQRIRRPSGNSGTSQLGETVQEPALSIRPEAYRPRAPRPQQDTQSGPAPDTPPDTGGTVPEPEHTKPGIIIEPATPAPGLNPFSEQRSDLQPQPKDEPHPGTNSDSGPDHPHSRSPSPSTRDIPIIDGQVPPRSRSPSPYPKSDNDPEREPNQDNTNGDLPVTIHRRKPSAEPLPVVIANVEILNNKNEWHGMQVRLDTSLYIGNRHDKRGKGGEIHYYGIISLRTLIDELGWPDETLLEDPKFVEIPGGTRFSWDSKHHEGIGRVTLTWRVDRPDDEWEIGVVPKMTRECIVSREDPCEQGVVLKVMPRRRMPRREA